MKAQGWQNPYCPCIAPEKWIVKLMLSLNKFCTLIMSLSAKKGVWERKLFSKVIYKVLYLIQLMITKAPRLLDIVKSAQR